MKLGNSPIKREDIEVGKLYWNLNIGKNAIASRYFEGGWRAFEFVIFRPSQIPLQGDGIRYIFRFAFAYWFPFYIT